MADAPVYDTTPPKVVSPWPWIAVLGITVAGFWFTVLVYVPAKQHQFNSLGLWLPPFTEGVLTVSHVLNGSWLVFGPASIVTIVLLAVAIYKNWISSKAGKRLAQAATLLLVGLICIASFALTMPLVRFLQSLTW